MRRKKQPSGQATAPRHCRRLLTATLSPPALNSVDNAPSEGRRRTRATGPRAVVEPRQQTGGCRGGTPRATCAHAHARQAASRQPPGGLPRAPLPEGTAGPTVVACGAPGRAPPRWPQEGWWRAANEQKASECGGRSCRVTGFGQCVTTRSQIWMGRAAAPSSVFLRNLALGGGGGCGRLSRRCRRRPAGGGRAPGPCAGGAMDDATAAPQWWEMPSAGPHRCVADVPSDRAGTRRSRSRRRSRPRGGTRRDGHLEWQLGVAATCGPRVVASGGRQSGRHRLGRGATDGNFSSEVDSGAHQPTGGHDWRPPAISFSLVRPDRLDIRPPPVAVGTPASTFHRWRTRSPHNCECVRARLWHSRLSV